MARTTARSGSLVIGSRGSQLALWQAGHVAALLDRVGIATRIQVIKTTGDRLQTASLIEAGGKGLFTKEVEEALLAGEIDVAVHSLKDLPPESPSRLVLAAIPERDDPRDAMVGCELGKLPAGAHVGTGSGRRAAQLLLLRPDLRVTPIRGNVDTRLRKLKSGEYDAIVLAAAGMRRLGFEREIAQIFSPEQMCPAAGQGALAIQTREDDRAREICSQLNDVPSSRAVRCERALQETLGGGCQLPIGVYARCVGHAIEVMAIVISPDGTRHVRASRQGPAENPEELGRAAAWELLQRGAREILLQSAERAPA